MTTTENPTGTCADVCQHLDEPERRPLLVRVDRKTDKDTEIMPLVRWQFRGLPQDQRSAASLTSPPRQAYDYVT
jgi:hypothetical protein